MKIFKAHTDSMYYRYTRFLGAIFMVALMATSFAMAILYAPESRRNNCFVVTSFPEHLFLKDISRYVILAQQLR